MSYLVLARKYRPRTFGEVAGQDVVTRTLRGAISAGRIGHAYLFHGPRGTGKTTSARLFAKALNCDRGPAEDACGECERCLAFDAGAEADLLEIDAASNTGVDHVRGLRDQAAYVPLRARFKVFLVDEVHMLSKAAFNALLKTLEEPPPHVKFLFATTELHKVPDTIVSRCQVLRLDPLPEATIAARLEEIFAAEGVAAEAGVAAELARRARGGMRDALSLADQLIAHAGTSPTLVDCSQLAGDESAEAVARVVDALLASDPHAALAALPEREGGEAAFLAALLDHLRTALVLALVGDDAPMVRVAGGADARRALAERGRAIGAERAELWLQELLHARERMGGAPLRPHARVVLEVTLLDLCRPEASVDLGALAARLEALEGRLGGAPAPAPARSGPAPARPPASGRAASPDRAPVAPRRARRKEAASDPEGEPAADELRPAPPPSAASRPRPSPDPRPAKGGGRARVQTRSTADAWEGFLAELDGRSAALVGLLRRRAKLARYGGGEAVVRLEKLAADERALLEDRRNVRTIERAFSDAVGRSVRVLLQDASARREGKADPFTREVADLFGGRIDD